MKVSKKLKKLLPDEVGLEVEGPPPKIRAYARKRLRVNDLPPGVRAMERRP